MELGRIKDILDASFLSRDNDMGINITSVYSADLMSDVLAFSITNSLLITHLTNAQVIRTAEVADVQAIVFVQGKKPDVETIVLANEKKIPLLVTNLSMFEACGVLHEKGLRSCCDKSSDGKDI
jgi:predicted transcriptional regulator